MLTNTISFNLQVRLTGGQTSESCCLGWNLSSALEWLWPRPITKPHFPCLRNSYFINWLWKLNYIMHGTLLTGHLTWKLLIKHELLYCYHPHLIDINFKALGIMLLSGCSPGKVLLGPKLGFLYLTRTTFICCLSNFMTFLSQRYHIKVFHWWSCLVALVLNSSSRSQREREFLWYRGTERKWWIRFYGCS